MKKFIIALSLLLTIGLLSFGQASDPLASKCAISAGDDAKYVKDFIVKLGKGDAKGELRFKAPCSLWKNTKYRFTMCNSQDSKGQLILSIKDEANKTIISSYDPKTGKVYPYFDFVCNKSGKYMLNYDFTDGQQGSGVGVVSMVK
jgi:hypothetical protein